MTRFALTIWAWRITGSALALVGFFSFALMVLFSPIAGALVDRWPRKLVMMVDKKHYARATGTLLFVHIPQPKRTQAGDESRAVRSGRLSLPGCASG
jgi:MFS transporter, DHA3 family, macrolide efflux protein